METTSAGKQAARKTGSRDIVLSCIQALNEENFDTARKSFSDDMVFEGVLGSRHGAEAYFNDMKKMKLKYNVQKAFEDGDDVCLLYNLQLSGLNIFGCGWYHLENGRIKSLKVVFDPRPVLEKSGK